MTHEEIGEKIFWIYSNIDTDFNLNLLSIEEARQKAKSETSALLTTYRAQVLKEAAELAQKSHAEVMKNCERHPNGMRGCRRCSMNKISKIILGGFLYKLKELSTRNLDITP